MALRERRPNPHIPSTFQGPPKCRKERDGKTCGNDAFHTVSGQVEVMEKIVPVKFPICDICLSALQERKES